MTTRELSKDSRDIFFNDYCNIVKTAQQLLKENPEWQARYTGYIKKISSISSEFKLSEPKNLFYYTNMTSINHSNNSKLIAQIRYKGQQIAELHKITNNQKEDHYLFFINGVNNKCKKKTIAEMNCETFPGYTDIKILNQEYGIPNCNWESSEEAEAFKKFFESSPRKGLSNKDQEGNREHILESAFLSEIGKSTSDNKKILRIQPIKLKGLRFQFPTPFSASHLHADPINAYTLPNLKYSGHNVGPIDILARRKKGNKSYITVIELKDENKKGNNETPEIAIRQAIAYATFLRELIRYDAVNGDADSSWYTSLGLNPKTLENDLVIKCVIAMPDISDPNLFSKAELTEIPLSDSTDKYQDKLLLHCIKIVLQNDDKNEITKLIPDKDF